MASYNYHYNKCTKRAYRPNRANKQIEQKWLLERFPEWFCNQFDYGGISPRFLIIDDGCQSISLDGEEPFEDARNLVLGRSQMTARLCSFKENGKFRKYNVGTMLGENSLSFDLK
ncbi:hypothetical protein Syun_006850 [Stephania yunnanensis]|uniref:Uncharacterized protein n=1 Tax=Stephania yunnanensis TaxID=152371 RepID=A0AAP0PZQ4_9MAGN